jgi:manganese/zinc/iron transport system substrate-binding protein
MAAPLHPRSRALRRATALGRGLAPWCAAALLAACSPSSEGAGRTEDPTTDRRVITTTAMVGDVVASLAGDHFAVETLLGSGVDPHLYRPNRDDVARLMRADLVVSSGLHLEGRMGETLAGLASDTRRVVAFAELLLDERDPELALLGDPEATAGEGAPHTAYDPHAWMDPLRWARAAELLAPTLVELAPAEHRDEVRRDVLESTLPRFRASADALVAFGNVCFASIPKKQRVLVTAHDAFRYLGERFGLEVLGLQGLSTESEAGMRRIEELVDLLVQRRIPAVFVESSVPDRAVKALVEGARARGHVVDIGGELHSDAMGEPGTYEGTYVGMIAHNITTITRGLGGRVPGGSFEIWRSVAFGALRDSKLELGYTESSNQRATGDVGVSGAKAAEDGR